MHYVQSQYIDVDMISGYAFDDPIPLDDLYSQVFIDHYGKDECLFYLLAANIQNN